MKKQFLKLLVFLIFLFVIAASCNPELEPVLPEKEYSICDKWKLVGFVEVETDEIKEIEPKDERCFLLTFNENKTLSGVSSSNPLQGNYDISYTTGSIYITIGQCTYINETLDGRLYVNSLNEVDFFSLQENELRLYYNNKRNFLFFKLQKP